MVRRIISTKELQVWLTAEIKKHEGCHDCHFGGITSLRTPDEAGCNWADRIVIRATGVPPEIYEPAVAIVMTKARSQFNVS